MPTRTCKRFGAGVLERRPAVRSLGREERDVCEQIVEDELHSSGCTFRSKKRELQTDCEVEMARSRNPSVS